MCCVMLKCNFEGQMLSRGHPGRCKASAMTLVPINTGKVAGMWPFLILIHMPVNGAAVPHSVIGLGGVSQVKFNIHGAAVM